MSEVLQCPEKARGGGVLPPRWVSSQARWPWAHPDTPQHILPAKTQTGKAGAAAGLEHLLLALPELPATPCQPPSQPVVRRS